MKNIILILISFLCCSCRVDGESDIYERVPLVLEIPSNFPDLQYNLSSNPITNHGFELGRRLFYEGKLSSDGKVSCGFCHTQQNAFTHHGHQFSHGVENREGTRNAPPIQNVAFQKQFMADGATRSIDRFSILPITNPLEMNETMENILSKLKADKEYQRLFGLAFDDGEINMSNTLKSLSQFMLMMVSANSKYDKYVRKEVGGNFTQQEKQGLKVFKDKCASCHSTDLFTDDSFRNNGLLVDPVLQDKGRAVVTSADEDKYKFKVPSLRNIALTKPYMHDGRFYTLERVLNFYAKDVKNTENLDDVLKLPNHKFGIELKDQDQKDIIVFLKTLTDEQFINDSRFSE